MPLPRRRGRLARWATQRGTERVSASAAWEGPLPVPVPPPVRTGSAQATTTRREDPPFRVAGQRRRTSTSTSAPRSASVETLPTTSSRPSLPPPPPPAVHLRPPRPQRGEAGRRAWRYIIRNRKDKEKKISFQKENSSLNSKSSSFMVGVWATYLRKN